MEVLPSDTPLLFEENTLSLGRAASVTHPTLTKNAIPSNHVCDGSYVLRGYG